MVNLTLAGSMHLLYSYVIFMKNRSVWLFEYPLSSSRSGEKKKKLFMHTCMSHASISLYKFPTNIGIHVIFMSKIFW